MSSHISLFHSTGILRGTVTLPASKSESNRALLIQALSREKTILHNLSGAHDTVLLQELLQEKGQTINAEDAGTVMRFLTAYFSLTGQPKTLTGTERMCQRPIGILVEALRELGAEIEYLGQEGFPPLKLLGFNLKQTNKAELRMRGDVSSQFISALLLCSPVLKSGLAIKLAGKIASRPYLEMTLALMAHFGVTAAFSENRIDVLPQNYGGGEFTVEADWSAASYWYSMVALAQEAEVVLTGLKPDSLQGDSALVRLMEGFGVKTTFISNGIKLTKMPVTTQETTIDFTGIPDLAQTFAVLAAAKKIPLKMTGLESLRLKETDRIAALQTELSKLGGTLTETSPGTFLVDNDTVLVPKTRFKTYYDHRMAMALAPLALLQEITIEDPEVVRKSYPQFWEELRKIGFEIKE